MKVYIYALTCGKASPEVLLNLPGSVARKLLGSPWITVPSRWKTITNRARSGTELGYCHQRTPYAGYSLLLCLKVDRSGVDQGSFKSKPIFSLSSRHGNEDLRRADAAGMHDSFGCGPAERIRNPRIIHAYAGMSGAWCQRKLCRLQGSGGQTRVLHKPSAL